MEKTLNHLKSKHLTPDKKTKFYKWIALIDAFYAVLHTTAMVLIGGGLIFSVGDIGGLYIFLLSLCISSIYMVVHGIVVYIKTKNIFIPNIIALACGVLFSAIMAFSMIDDFHFRLVLEFAIIWCILVGISFVASIASMLISFIYKAIRATVNSPTE